MINQIIWYSRRTLSIARRYGARGVVRAVYSKLRYGHLDYTHLAAANGSARSSVNAHCSASGQASRPLIRDDLVVIAGVPFDDIGGGQRGAQLARVALQTGRNVHYVYIFQKFDFENGVPVVSNVSQPRLRHEYIEEINPEDLFSGVHASATVLIELPHPKIIPFMELAKARGLRVVFDLIDEWDTSLGGEWFDKVVFRKFVHEADVVAGSAGVLVDKLRGMGRLDALYVPNAANEAIFDKYRNYQRPRDLPQDRRIALYFGSLYGEWFAWDYIEAAARQNPGTALVLIGDLAHPPALPDNVYFLGSKQIDELPAYLHYSDLALLPFVPGKISDAVSPIKIFEYLFLDKAVVATTLPEIMEYPNVFIANSAVDFATLCGDDLKYIGSPLENDRFIMRNSWLHRLETLCGGRGQDKEVSVIILIHNNEEIIERCIESVIMHAGEFTKEIIVVDNASRDRGSEIVRSEFPSVKLISNPENGCASGRNLGAAAATGSILAFLDSDQWLTGGAAFAEAISILQNDASIGAVGWAAGWFNDHEGDVGGPIVDYLPNRGMDETARLRGYRTDIGYIGTGGMFIPRSVFERTRGFDPKYDPTCFEDTDLSFSVREIGLRVAYRDLTGIRHQPHQTTGASDGDTAYKALFNRNARYFKEKWSKCPSGHFLNQQNRLADLALRGRNPL